MRQGRNKGLRTRSLVIALPVLDYGGIESHTVFHAQGMLEAFAEVRVCTMSSDGRAAEDLRRQGVTVDVLNTTPSVRNPIATFRLWRYLRVHRPDILHARSGAMTVHGLIAGKLSGVPVRIAEEVGIPKRGRAGHKVFPWLYRLASAVVGVSNATVHYLVNQDGVPARKAVLVYNAVDDRYFNVERQVDSCSSKQILSVGRLVPVKAHDILIRAAAPLLESFPSANLQIAGEGPERSKLESLAVELSVEGSVGFLGHRTDVDLLLAEADVFVLCSYSEGLPLALVEAMAARVPIVATRAGGTPEVVPGSQILSLVEPGDVEGLRNEILRILTIDQRERAILVERCKTHAAQIFHSDRYKRDLLKLYGRLLEESGK